MDRDKASAELRRLIAEAPSIAPSIRRFDEERSYGNVTDEDLDLPSFVLKEFLKKTPLAATSSEGKNA